MPKLDPKNLKTGAAKPNPMGSMDMSPRIVDLGPITHAATFADHLSLLLSRLQLRLPPRPSRSASSVPSAHSTAPVRWGRSFTFTARCTTNTVRCDFCPGTEYFCT